MGYNNNLSAYAEYHGWSALAVVPLGRRLDEPVDEALVDLVEAQRAKTGASARFRRRNEGYYGWSALAVVLLGRRSDDPIEASL